MVAMQWRSNSESGAVTFLEFLEQRGQYGGSIDLPAVLLAPAVCGHCGKLEDLRRDWNTYSHNRESAPKNHELTVPESDVDGSLADRIAQIAFEENTCFMCAKTILEATQWIDGDDHCCNTPLHYAARSGNLRMLFHLIYQLGHLYGHEWTVLVLRKLNVHGETALHEAIRLGRSKCMVGMLMWVDPDLALHPGVGTSPLYLAVSLGHKHIAEMLHSTSGGNLSYSGPDGQNALHAAVYRPYGMVQMLLDWNKDLSKDKDKNGSTPLHHVASEQSEDYINIWYGLEKHATWHVLDANPYAAYDKDKNGLLPLHIAALMDRKVPIRILLKMCRGCIALRDSKKGRSFLHIAVANKALNVVRYACQEPAFAPILNARDNDGNTALHLAVKVEVLAMFCRLLQNPKVLLNVRNNKEQTPLDLARSKTRTSFSYGLNPEISIYRTLIDAGARHGSFWRDSIQNQLSNLEDVENQSKQVVGTDHMEKEKKAEQKDSDVVSESSRVLGIGSVLIATMTFGAAFTVPGTVKEGDKTTGVPTKLSVAWYLSTFVITNGVAFVYSSVATLCLMISGMSMFKLHIRRNYFWVSVFFASNALSFLSLAFALGVHVVLAPVGRKISVGIFVMSFCLLIFHNIGFVREQIVTYQPLSVRRGHKFACWLFIWRISLWGLVQFWPLIIFIN